MTGAASNTRSSIEALKHHSLMDEFAAYDSLPSEVQVALQVANTKWSAVPVLSTWTLAQQQGVYPFELVHHLDAHDRAELQAFASRYQMEYGLPLPHIAARVTILKNRRSA